MAEYFVDPANGSDANNGLSAASPWKKIPGQSGANAVVAGDIINVRNGTRSTGQLLLPANNLTYRGYGLAWNKLVLTLPAGRRKRTATVVRAPGLHEGMWTLDAAGDSVFGYLVFGSRSGCVIEDCEVLAPLSDTPVSMGTSGSTAIGATMRRCKVSGSKATGIAIYTRAATIEDSLIENIDDDAITFGATAANGNRAGYTDVVRRVSLIEPGMDVATGLGDGIQTFTNSGNYQGTLLLQDIYMLKSSVVKQAVVLNDGTGGIVLERFLFESTAGGHAQILLSGIKGSIIVRRGWIVDGCKDNAAIRLGQEAGVAMATGSRLLVESVCVDAAENNGLFAAASVDAASTADGYIGVHNCFINGRNVQALSFSAGLSAHAGAYLTWGANAVVSFRNNAILQSGRPAIRLPAGGAGNARWQVYNNAILDGVTAAAIGATEYASASAFQAAHAISGGNLQLPDYSIDPATYRPLDTSPLRGAGVFVGWMLDASSKRFRNPPCIGAFEYVKRRATPSNDSDPWSLR